MRSDVLRAAVSQDTDPPTPPSPPTPKSLPHPLSDSSRTQYCHPTMSVRIVAVYYGSD